MENKKPDYPEKDLLNLLESIILMQMLVENLEEMQFTHFNKGHAKIAIKGLLKQIVPIAEKDYNTVFNNGGDETIKIIKHYQLLVESISKRELPEKVLIAQFTQAWNIDSKSITGIVDKILAKRKKEITEK